MRGGLITSSQNEVAMVDSGEALALTQGPMVLTPLRMRGKMLPCDSWASSNERLLIRLFLNEPTPTRKLTLKV